MKWQFFSMKLATALLVVLTLACSAEDGEDGAIGPQGPQGEQGSAGSQGEQGEQGPPGADGQDGQDGADGQDGTDGNANVISSGWFEIDTWNTDLPDFKFHRIPDLILTEFQRENDLILVYRRYQPTPAFTQIALLPVTVYDASGAPELSLTSPIQGNGLFIQIQAFDRNVTSEEYLPPETQFRYIIIPADDTTSKHAKDFSKMNYEEVMDHFGIEQ